MRTLARGLVDLLLPPLCVRCSAHLPDGFDLCDACLRALPEFGDPDPPPPGVAHCAAGVAYRGEVLEWVQRFKYPARGLAGLDAAALGFFRGVMRRAAATPALPRAGLVIPIPLHPRRLRRRGFNPAMLLARTAARNAGAPADATALRRVRDTRSQTGLGVAERRRNVRGAFRVRRGLDLPPTVWLVDDVVTTGSTVSDAARALLGAGARTVVVVCAARTPRTGRGESAGVSPSAASPSDP